MKNKSKKVHNKTLALGSVMKTCEKCGGVFWSYYNIKESGKVEKVCAGCK